jgi:hypothetical protein
MAMVVAVPMIVVSLIMGVSVPGIVRVYRSCSWDTS